MVEWPEVVAAAQPSALLVVARIAEALLTVRMGIALLSPLGVIHPIRAASAFALGAIPGGGVGAGPDPLGRPGDGDGPAASDGPAHSTHLQRSRTRTTPLLTPTTELHLP